jgi:hypothetical protein
MKTCWYWQKTDMKTNGIDDPDTNPHSYSHLIVEKGAQNMHCRKDSLFNKWCWEN